MAEYIEREELSAVKVVRCKDCRYYMAEGRRCDHPNLAYEVECYDHWVGMGENDFCSYGERRTVDEPIPEGIEEKIEDVIEYIFDFGFDFLTTDMLRRELKEFAEFVRNETAIKE